MQSASSIEDYANRLYRAWQIGQKEKNNGVLLLVFTQDGAPMWEVRRRAAAGGSRDDLVASGGADTFEAAKSAALFELNAIQEAPRGKP